MCLVFHKKEFTSVFIGGFQRKPQELTSLEGAHTGLKSPTRSKTGTLTVDGLYIMLNLNKGFCTFKRIFKNLLDATETKEHVKIKDLSEAVCIEKIMLASESEGHRCEGQLRPTASSAWLTEHSVRMA